MLRDISQIASIDGTQKGCIVGNIGTRFWKAWHKKGDISGSSVNSDSNDYITHNFSRLHAASPRATKNFILLFSHIQYYSTRPVDTL